MEDFLQCTLSTVRGQQLEDIFFNDSINSNGSILIFSSDLKFCVLLFQSFHGVGNFFPWLELSFCLFKNLLSFPFSFQPLCWILQHLLELLSPALEVSMHFIPLALYLFNWWNTKEIKAEVFKRFFLFFFLIMFFKGRKSYIKILLELTISENSCSCKLQLHQSLVQQKRTDKLFWVTQYGIVAHSMCFNAYAARNGRFMPQKPIWNRTTFEKKYLQ